MQVTIILSTLLSVVAAVRFHPNTPACGLAATMSAFRSSGCDFSDVSCLCNNKEFLDALQSRVPGACRTIEQQNLYYHNMNNLCSGQASFPFAFAGLAKRQDTTTDIASAASTAPQAGNIDAAGAGTTLLATASAIETASVTAPATFSTISNQPLQTFVSISSMTGNTTMMTQTSSASTPAATSASSGTTSGSESLMHTRPESIGLLIGIAILALAGF